MRLQAIEWGCLAAILALLGLCLFVTGCTMSWDDGGSSGTRTQFKVSPLFGSCDEGVRPVLVCPPGQGPDSKPGEGSK